MKEYYSDYPKEPIGKPNPYWCCSYCGISDPQINGRLDGHDSNCAYRIKMQEEGHIDEHNC